MIARAIGHEARLPLLTHVDELRVRLIISVATLAVAFGFAFWQNHALLNVLNRPLANATSGALAHSRGPLAEGRSNATGRARRPESPARRFRAASAGVDGAAAGRTPGSRLGGPSRRRRGGCDAEQAARTPAGDARNRRAVQVKP